MLDSTTSLPSVGTVAVIVSQGQERAIVTPFLRRRRTKPNPGDGPSLAKLIDKIQVTATLSRPLIDA